MSLYHQGRLVRILRSVFFYVVLVFSTIVLGTLAILAASIFPNGKVSHLCGRLWGNVNLWAAGVRVRVKGLENIENDQAYVFLANHQGWFDIFALLGKLPLQFRWLAKEELFKIPILGRAMISAGYIPINRSDRRKAFESMNQAAEKVQNGTSVIIFPEGTRSPNGVLQEFKKGGFILAIKSKQPIVPISISGSHLILPKGGGWVIQPGVIHVAIDHPIKTCELTSKDTDALMQRVREKILRNLTAEESGSSIDKP